MDKLLLAFIKKHGRLPKISEYESVGLTEYAVKKMGGRLAILKKLKKEHKDLYTEVYVDRKKELITSTYARLVKETGRHPAHIEMLREGITESTIRHHFTSMVNLREYMKVHKPEVFNDLFTDSEFTPDRFADLLKKIKKHKRFVITTALAGGKVDRKFYDNLKSYCEEKSALLLIIPIADPVSNRSVVGTNMAFDPILRDEQFVFDDIKLNENFYISGLRLQAKAINPFTGLQRIARKTGNFIYGAPKQSLEMVASETHPTALMTPGAITYSDYSSDMYISQRTSYIAEKDHIMGAVVVEIENDKEFFFRQLQSNIKGQFIDLGILYSGQTRTKVDSIFSMGDLHSWTRDKHLVDTIWKDVVKTLGCSKLILHDAFDGHSCNPHTKGRHLQRSQSRVPVLEELNELAQTIKNIQSWGADVYRASSNHDDFLSRWLDSGDYVQDPENAKIGHELWLVKHEGADPVAYSLGIRGVNIKNLGRKDSLVFGGVECGKHGDKGANGSKGSKGQHEKSYVNSMTGHEHTPGIKGGAWVIGTSTGIGEHAPSYAIGASSWLQCSGITYATGHRQLIIAINGKWKMTEGKKK